MSDGCRAGQHRQRQRASEQQSRRGPQGTCGCGCEAGWHMPWQAESAHYSHPPSSSAPQDIKPIALPPNPAGPSPCPHSHTGQGMLRVCPIPRRAQGTLPSAPRALGLRPCCLPHPRLSEAYELTLHFRTWKLSADVARATVPPPQNTALWEEGKKGLGISVHGQLGLSAPSSE